MGNLRDLPSFSPSARLQAWQNPKDSGQNRRFLWSGNEPLSLDQYRFASAHEACEIRHWKRVEYVGFGQPRPPQLQDAIADLLHVRGMVRVSVDNKLHALRFRHAQVEVAQIKPVRVSVVFHRNAGFRGSGEYLIAIKVVAFAPQQHSSRGMPDDRRMRILDHAQ